jgi:protein-disulfide isomerase
MPSEPGGGSSPVVTLRIRRTHLAAIIGLVIGLAAGIAIGGVIADEDPEYRLASPLAGLPPTPQSGAAAPLSSEPVDIETAGRPAIGPADAEVTIAEFVDFQCPFCRNFHLETRPRLLEKYGDRIRLVSLHFPLSIHPLAIPAARAAECAFEGGRFAAYQDALFKNQEGLTAARLPQLAADVGLDSAEFEDCLSNPRTARAVSEDESDGRALGVTGTPTFFIDGRRLVGALPYAQFSALIDTALAR